MDAKSGKGPLRAAGLVVVTGGAGRERFLLLHNPLHREWGFPKGHLEEGEEDLVAALRELREETGIEAVAVDPLFRAELRYRVARGGGREGPDGGAEKVVVYFLGRVRDESHRLSPEHDRSGWFSAHETVERLKHANLRDVARRAARHVRWTGTPEAK